MHVVNMFPMLRVKTTSSKLKKYSTNLTLIKHNPLLDMVIALYNIVYKRVSTGSFWIIMIAQHLFCYQLDKVNRVIVLYYYCISHSEDKNVSRVNLGFKS